MKPTTILVNALAAAVVSAAPTSTGPASTESKRVAASVDLNAFNQFAFQNQDLQYFNAINGLDLNGLVQLSVSSGLDLGVFQSVFVQDVVDVNALLQLQQVALLSQLGGLGALVGFDLGSVQIDVLDLGLLGDSVGAFDLSSLVDQALVPQLQTVIQQTDITAVVLKG